MLFLRRRGKGSSVILPAPLADRGKMICVNPLFCQVVKFVPQHCVNLPHCLNLNITDGV